MNYRYDNRTEEEFTKQIKERTLTERKLFLLWLDHVEKETGKRPDFKDTGCGNRGELLEDSKVSTDPDFEVEGYGKIEVKFSNPLLKKIFHLKKSQVKSYINKDTTILMVNGASEDVPEFTIIKTDALKNIAEKNKVVNWRGFGMKPAYRIEVKKFIWRKIK